MMRTGSDLNNRFFSKNCHSRKQSTSGILLKTEKDSRLGESPEETGRARNNNYKTSLPIPMGEDYTRRIKC